MEIGGVIGIDFGYVFGFVIQFLLVFELMFFWLICQFINLMLLMKEMGFMYSIMVYVFWVFCLDFGLFINIMDVFVKEFFFDWKNFEQKMLKKGGLWI